jgi:hypothetical protein
MKTCSDPTMDLAAFKLTLSQTTPPADLAGPLQGLWWAAKGDWDKAHKLVQDDSGPAAAWVHAYLHRVEGDLPNAGYWYRSAHRPVARGPLDEEWAEIVADLLAR